MNKVIILLGPTGSGKTAVSILLAKALHTEIISADSMQIYRHMNIGTAKPSSSELQEVKHYLINILSPSESFSAGMFKDMAAKIINDLHGGGMIPIVTGGTGLYIKALTRGLFEGPSADWRLREQLFEEERLHAKGYLHKRLTEIDPEAAGKINPQDTRRIIRALEVYIKEKKSISELQRSGTAAGAYEFIKIGLLRDRNELYRIIEQRVDKMIEDGLVDEVKRVLKIVSGDSFLNLQPSTFSLQLPSLSSMQSLGYKEMSLYLSGLMSIEDAVRLLKKRTKMYAKRQFTWFKKEPDIKWVDITGIMHPEEIFQKVINDVEILRELLYVRRQ
ncbi:MAG: tRNA (adenosine(37)-N6)-dimethylallyltransferase MiaA [Nitrospirae bacterium]|nr:tRNA (adenosine(37)-N6)-dimethylallyltransferase MiaA [Nitrospirota bacterium]